MDTTRDKPAYGKSKFKRMKVDQHKKIVSSLDIEAGQLELDEEKCTN